MRAALLFGVMMLASCGSSGGIELVVTPPPDVDRIALYVGIGDEVRQSIAPEGAGSTSYSTWIRDAHNELSQVTGVGGKTVSFGLLGPSEPISMLIVVGFNADGKPVATAVLPPEARPLKVPNTYVARYELTLVPTVAVDPQSSYDVRVWKPTDPSAPGEQAECVAALQLRNGSERIAIVPENDPDCDAWTSDDRTTECLTDVFMGTKPPKLDGLNCILPKPLTDPNNGGTIQTAVLGGDECIDGKGNVHGCFPSNYCVPKSTLDACGMGGFACAQDVSQDSNISTRMVCSINHDGQGHLCGAPILAFQNPGAVVDTHGCKAGSLRITRPSQPWGTTVAVTTSAGSANFSLTVASPTADCGTFTITPSASPIPALTSSLKAGALLAVDLDNGRGIAMPYEFFVESSSVGCDQPQPPCSLQPGPGTIPDGTFVCMKSPPL